VDTIPGVRLKNNFDAFVLALRLAVGADTEENSAMCLTMAEEFALNLSEKEVARAKNMIERETGTLKLEKRKMRKMRKKERAAQTRPERPEREVFSDPASLAKEHRKEVARLAKAKKKLMRDQQTQERADRLLLWEETAAEREAAKLTAAAEHCRRKREAELLEQKQASLKCLEQEWTSRRRQVVRGEIGLLVK
jgi:hypothetical protein